MTIIVIFGGTAFLSSTLTANAQSCSGLYNRANLAVTAYDKYNADAKSRAAKSNYLTQAHAFLDYDEEYESGFLKQGADWEAAISQCDPDTRVGYYKALIDIVLFLTRSGDYKRRWLDGASRILRHLDDVLRKTSTVDPELPMLTNALKRAYNTAHLSIPEDLLYVDRNAFGVRAESHHSSCASPNRDADVVQSVTPDYPETARELGLGQVTVQVKVTVSPSGNLVGASIFQSSNNMSLDQAALSAARQSTYSPKVVNCKAVTGDYLLKVPFDPNQ